MKKALAFTLVTALLLTAAACGQAIAADKVYTIRFSSPYGIGTMLFDTVEWWAEQLKTRSNGRLVVEHYPGSQLLPTDQQYSAMYDGRIQASYANISSKVALEPLMSVLQLPFLNNDGTMFDPNKGNFKYLENTMAFTSDPVYVDIAEGAMKKRGIISWITWVEGPRYLATSKKPINHLSDLVGMKIRITGGKWNEAACRALGFSAVAIPTAEVSTALAQGTVDGALLSTINSFEAKYPFSYFNTFPADSNPFETFDMSLEFLESLPADLQKIIYETGTDLTAMTRDTLKARLLVAFDNLRSVGVTIIEPSKEELTKARDAVIPVWQQFADEGKDHKALVKKYLEITYGPNNFIK